jgi:hypothetical protein
MMRGGVYNQLMLLLKKLKLYVCTGKECSYQTYVLYVLPAACMPQQILPILFSVKDGVDARAIGIGSMKNTNDTIGNRSCENLV